MPMRPAAEHPTSQCLSSILLRNISSLPIHHPKQLAVASSVILNCSISFLPLSILYGCVRQARQRVNLRPQIQIQTLAADARGGVGESNKKVGITSIEAAVRTANYRPRYIRRRIFVST